jgi:hypothetical protein
LARWRPTPARSCALAGTRSAPQAGLASSRASAGAHGRGSRKAHLPFSATCSGKAVARDELVALALDVWPLEWIEEALDTRAADVLPEAVRSRNVALRLPRYQAAMLDYLARQQQTTAGHVVSRALDDLASEHLDVLAKAIVGFAEAFAWPHVDGEQPPC